MKLNKKDLLEALEIVKPGLANTELIKQSTSYVFKKDRVITFNDSVGMSHPIEGLDIEGAVRAEELFNFLKQLKMEEIQIKVTDNEILFKSGKAKAGIRLQSKIELPLAEVEEVKDWYDLHEDFLINLDFTKDTCSRDMSQRKLTCVHATNTIVEASDGFRIIRVYMNDDSQEFDLLIPSELISHILKINPIQWSETDGWIHFRNMDGTEISCRVLNDEYPSTSEFFEIEGHKIKFPKSMSEILDKAMVFTKNENSFEEEILVLIKKNKIKVKGENDYGWFEETASVKYEGDSASFKITPYLLKNILERSDEGVLGSEKIHFSGEDWEYIATLRG